MKAFEQRIKEALVEMRALHTQAAVQLIPENATEEEARQILDEKYIDIMRRHLYLYNELEILFLSIESAECIAAIRQSLLYKLLVHHQYLEEAAEFGTNP